MRFSPVAALVVACSGTILAQNYAVSVPHEFEGEEGREPVDLIQASDGLFIGVAAQGGLGYGTVFQLKAPERITRVHRFRGADGANPNGLIEAKDGNLYGTIGGTPGGPTGAVFGAPVQHRRTHEA